VEHLVLIEPVLFALLEGHDDEAWAQVRMASSPFSLRNLVDFWGGVGAWDKLPMDRQFRLMAEEPRIRRQLARAARLPIEVEAMRAFPVRTTVVCGTDTVAPSITLCRLLAEVFPEATLRMVDGAGHASIHTHPEELAALISEQ
jgi:pimeloyl-ACP methyl ester carboxylesterase